MPSSSAKAADEAVVRLRDVGRSFRMTPPVHALRDVNLEIRDGDYVAVIGHSGAGKSTLLNILGLLDRPSRGQFLFCGDDVGAASDAVRTRIRRNHIGFVFQDSRLLDHVDTAANVSLGLMYGGVVRSERRRIAETCLREVGLGHRLRAAPNTLSGGERQRVAIARALAGKPRLLLCDEPTGNLDSKSGATVLSLLDRLHAAGSTLVVITHSETVAAAADRVVAIHDGRLAPR